MDETTVPGFNPDHEKYLTEALEINAEYDRLLKDNSTFWNLLQQNKYMGKKGGINPIVAQGMRLENALYDSTEKIRQGQRPHYSIEQLREGLRRFKIKFLGKAK
jgi:hypothetical protein